MISVFSELIRAQLIRWRRWIISLLGVIFISLQLIEHPVDFSARNPYHIFEITSLIILLLVLGILLELLLRTIDSKTHAVNALNLKHKFSLKLASSPSWDDLINFIVSFIGSVANPNQISLLVTDEQFARFKIAAESGPKGIPSANPLVSRPVDICRDCAVRNPHELHSLKSCPHLEELNSNTQTNGYCLPISLGKELVAMAHFYLPPAEALNQEQFDILNNIGPELATHLKTAQQQQLLAEKALTEAVSVERRNFSKDLHDTLGQDLGFLRFKLDQLSREDDLPDPEELKPGLVELRYVADEAYDLIRGTLAALLQNNTPILSTLLQDQARLIADHGNFEHQFSEQGTPRLLTSHALQQTYFVYREAMNNVARHASAHHAKTNLIWNEDSLVIKISDDGRGFDLQELDTQNHYGLGIMRERVEALKGCLHLTTAPGAGTEISIWLPFSDSQIPIHLYPAIS